MANRTKPVAMLTADERAHRNRIKRASDHRNVERVRRSRLSKYHRYRREALEAYGGHCACCRETEIIFLAIDHVYGGGTTHRKLVGRGARFYMWLKRHGFPPGFRVLCHNCNQAFGGYGRCPHQNRPGVVADLVRRVS